MLDDILRSHLIEPKYIRNDDFESFYNARMQALSEVISEAMDKPVVTETATDEPERDVEFRDDEVAELETVA